MDQVNVLEILREAMQLEKDGIRFYNRAAKCSKDKGVEEVFKQLAEGELRHLEKLELLYDNLSESNEWLVMQDLLAPCSKRMEDLGLFAEDVCGGELDVAAAVNMGIKAEEDSIAFYKKALGKCELADKRGCEVFTWLLGLEKEHLKLLKERRGVLARSK